MCACCRPQNSAHCPRKTPGLSRVEDDVVRLAGDHVDLPVQLGHPEAVDHVGARHPDVHRHPDRDVDLVRRARAVRRIGDVPEPLPSDDVDGEARRAKRRRRLGQRVDSQHEERDENDRRHDHARDHHERRPGARAPTLLGGIARRRRSPTASKATTTAKTIADPTSITHQSVSIVPTGPLCASNVDCPPPQPARSRVRSERVTACAPRTADRLPRVSFARFV